MKKESNKKEARNERFNAFPCLFNKDGGYLLSHCYAVPSARLGLTSLFGMGRGGSPIL